MPSSSSSYATTYLVCAFTFTAHQLVDVDTLVALRRQYAHIMRDAATGRKMVEQHATHGGDGEGGEGGRAPAKLPQPERLDSLALFYHSVQVSPGTPDSDQSVALACTHAHGHACTRAGICSLPHIRAQVDLTSYFGGPYLPLSFVPYLHILAQADKVRQRAADATVGTSLPGATPQDGSERYALHPGLHLTVLHG